MWQRVMSTNIEELFFAFAIEVEDDILYGELSFCEWRHGENPATR